MARRPLPPDRAAGHHADDRPAADRAGGPGRRARRRHHHVPLAADGAAGTRVRGGRALRGPARAVGRRPARPARPGLLPRRRRRLREHGAWGTRHEEFIARRLGEVEDAPTGVTLSQREHEILGYLRTTMTSAEIAEALFVSVNTVKTHQRAIYRKLGVANRREAVRVRHVLPPRGAVGLGGPPTGGRGSHPPRVTLGVTVATRAGRMTDTPTEELDRTAIRRLGARCSHLVRIPLGAPCLTCTFSSGSSVHADAWDRSGISGLRCDPASPAARSTPACRSRRARRRWVIRLAGRHLHRPPRP